MLRTNDEINKLKISPSLRKKLNNLNINKINDIWILKRKELKEVLNITLCIANDDLFISQEIINKLNISTTLPKKIKVNC